MKRLIALLLTMVVLVPAAFAGQVSVSGVLTQTIETGPEAVGNVMGLNKSRLMFGLKGDKGVDATIIAKIGDNGAGTYGDVGFDIDYAWVDAMVLGGKVRVGVQRLGLANYGGGIFQTNYFCLNTAVKGAGISYATEISGVATKVMIDKGLPMVGTAPDKAANRIGVLAKTKMSGANVGGAVIMGQAANSDDWGIAIEVEGDYKVGDLMLAGQLYYTGTKGAAALGGIQQLLGLYADYDYGMGNVYLDYMMPINDATKAALSAESVIDLGVSYALNAGLKTFFELSQTTAVGGTASGSSRLGVEASF